MKYWMDTEFIEDGKTIDLISIGIVAEDGRELYLENSECAIDKASEWVQQNVIPHTHACLGNSDGVCQEACPNRTRAEIAAAVQEFCDPGKHGKPEFWGYYADYDWVVFCQLFGTMMDLPKGFPMYCRDIKQFCDDKGNPKLPEQGKDEHHALADARWNRLAYEFLIEREIIKGMARVEEYNDQFRRPNPRGQYPVCMPMVNDVETCGRCGQPIQDGSRPCSAVPPEMRWGPDFPAA